MGKKTNIGIGIICPHCGKASNGDTIDSRPTAYGRRRRRICEHCGKRYTTIENCVSTQRRVNFNKIFGGE